MDGITIKRRIPIDSLHLHKGLRKHILRKIKVLTKDECSSDHGYILEVLDLKDIISSVVAPGTLENIFVVTFTAKVIKPEPGNIVEGVVWKVCEDGVFVLVADKFKVMVSEDEFDDLGYTKHPDGYEKDGAVIQVGSVVDVEIQHVRYECSKKQFSTIGTLTEQSKDNRE